MSANGRPNGAGKQPKRSGRRPRAITDQGAQGAVDRRTLLEFPASFPLKAIGTGPDDFEALVLAIVRRHVPALDHDASRTRLSGGGKYLAVTVTFVAESWDQLDALYAELQAHERVVMLL
jgi:putative lipoic acid-binding regulatory protein